MKALRYLLLAATAIFFFSCKNYYKTPQPMEIKSQYSETMFNLQVPNILKALQYEIEVINEEEKFVKAYKYIEYKDYDAKLFFEVSMPDGNIILNTYILKDKNYYIDRDKYPEEIKKLYLTDLETFIARTKGDKFPNRP
jgi:hypothetical protein